uniref:Class II aldolase/adducin N-terminal domain-containing protein n=1 Tax=Ditylenchus dipsaci TaxID=166011 RepID=A0A915D9I5_9BILA
MAFSVLCETKPLPSPKMNPSLCMHDLGVKPIIPIADINTKTTKYSEEEVDARNKLATLYRMVDFFQWSQGIYNHITLRLPNHTGDPTKSEILINPLGLLYKEMTASSLVKITHEGGVLDPGSTPLGINQAGFILHTAVHEAREDVACVLHMHTGACAAVSAMKCGLIVGLSQESMIIGPPAYHCYEGMLSNEDEKKLIAQHLGDKKVIFLRNHGLAVCGATVEEALHLAYNTLIACEIQVRALSVGLDNLILPSAKGIQIAYDTAQHGANGMGRSATADGKMVHSFETIGAVDWGLGELEWEAHMRIVDAAGYKTGYKYKLPALNDVIPKH